MLLNHKKKLRPKKFHRTSVKQMKFKKRENQIKMLTTDLVLMTVLEKFQNQFIVETLKHKKTISIQQKICVGTIESFRFNLKD